MSWRTFDVAVARWHLRLAGVPLPAAAMRSLEEGCDTPSLAVLAALDGRGWSEIDPVVRAVLEERGEPLPDDATAAERVADDLLRQLIAGEVTPEVAADRLGELGLVREGFAWPDLDRFRSLALDWELRVDFGLQDNAVRTAILREARAVLARGGVRPPGA